MAPKRKMTKVGTLTKYYIGQGPVYLLTLESVRLYQSSTVHTNKQKIISVTCRRDFTCLGYYGVAWRNSPWSEKP